MTDVNNKRKKELCIYACVGINMSSNFSIAMEGILVCMLFVIVCEASLV
jgi:hypothetical protein